MPLTPGLRAEVRIVVAEADTASAIGSGDVPVLATPRLLALAEAATVAAIRDHLDPGMTSVGTSVLLEHTAASPIGAEIVTLAQLTEVDRRRLVFNVEANEGDKQIGAARVERFVVDRQRFLDELNR
ncbi:MAG TPA: hotdog domain-containing protein [Streptosporangiaceae bacterium]|nr:hotdog domain-containing protein [Streptosporangiaceae bacterium]